jgi:protein-tyrosine-phosphatase
VAALPGAVLFACNLNRVRSPMAEGLMKRLFGDLVYVDSCGVRSGEDETPDAFMLAIMDEVGVDLCAHRQKTFEDLEDESYDAVISLTPEAQHRAVEMARSRAVALEYWPTHDPTLILGPRENVLDAYRAVRNALELRIRERFPTARTFGG